MMKIQDIKILNKIFNNFDNRSIVRMIEDQEWTQFKNIICHRITYRVPIQISHQLKIETGHQIIDLIINQIQE